MPHSKPINPAIEQVIHKLQTLSPEPVSEMEDFIDFFSQSDSDRGLTQAAMAAAELLKHSSVKPVLFTAEKPIVTKRLSQLQEDDQHATREVIAPVIGE